MKRLLLLLALLLAAPWIYWGELPFARDDRDDRLARERERLSAELGELLRRDRRLQGAPAGDVLVGVPASFGQELLRQVLRGLLDEIPLQLRDLQVSKSGSVHAKVLFRRTRIGEYRLQALIHEVRAVLSPGEPRITFKADRVGVELPLNVKRGTGRATIDFRWDSKSIAQPVCGDLATRQEVTGSLVAKSYLARGELVLSTAAGSLIAKPVFPGLVIPLQIEPSREAWGAVRSLLAGKGGLCGQAIRKLDVEEQLRGLLGRGLNVRLRPRVLEPVRLPAAFRPTLEVAGRRIDLSFEPAALKVGGDVLWFGARAGVAAP